MKESPKMGSGSGNPSQGKRSYWRTIQRRLASQISTRDSFHTPIELLAGVDVAYLRSKAFSAAVVLDYKTLQVMETKVASSNVSVPYVPSFFAFREVKPMVKVIRKLKKGVDVILVNAHGVAHPEKCGCASHLGVTLDIPTIGVARKPLCGTVLESDCGDIKYLKEGEEIIGAQLTTQVSPKPIYVSVGHRVGLISAIEIVRRTVKNNRMPEPLRLAHELSNEIRKRNLSTLSLQETLDEGG